jgi:N-methylhydantoinase A
MDRKPNHSDQLEGLTFGYRLGIDIGGTFTDFVLISSQTSDIAIEKVPTTPEDYWIGILAGIRKVGVEVSDISMIVHGTTVGLNTLIERKGSAVGLIATQGFRDVYEIGRHNRTETYDLFYRKPLPLVPRRYRLEVRERTDPNGNVVQPLIEPDVAACIETFRHAGIDSIAVCLINSYANPEHEQRIGEIIARDYPGATVSLSHDLVRQWREYERMSTTVINSYILPRVGGYLEAMEGSLSSLGYAGLFFVNRSSGGVMSVEAAKQKPVHTIMSGPSGGAAASAYLGQSIDRGNVIALDMGGTSTDVALVHEGDLRVTVESTVDRYPIMVPMVDIKAIGAGGGSIAWLDVAGALRVGPQSAGADPGPVSYGRGGSEPTVTDANLALGYLHPNYFLGGEMILDAELACKEIKKRIADPLGLSVIDAARGIIEVINTKMAYAVRAVTIERGLDPRAFALLAYGGAGPMHACAVARNLGIERIVVPVGPGTFSAMGMLVSDIRHDFVRTFPLSVAEGLSLKTINDKFEDIDDEATGVLVQEGVHRESMTFGRALDIRYVGQEYTITVPLTGNRTNRRSFEELENRFHLLHEQNYGHSSREEPIEIVNLRVTATGRVPQPRPRAAETGFSKSDETRIGETEAYFAGRPRSTPVYTRDALRAGNRVIGPAIVVEKSATTVVEPAFELEVLPQGHLWLRPVG